MLLSRGLCISETFEEGQTHRIACRAIQPGAQEGLFAWQSGSNRPRHPSGRRMVPRIRAGERPRAMTCCPIHDRFLSFNVGKDTCFPTPSWGVSRRRQDDLVGGERSRVLLLQTLALILSSETE